MTESELLESCSADGCCLTTGASGAVAGLNMFSLTEAKTLQLAGMNGSAMVSAGCGCGPSADSASAKHECQCESGVDVADGIPVDQVLAKRVDHKDALVANDQLGAHENQVRGQHEEQAPQGGCCGGGNVAAEPSFDGQSAANQKDDCCVGETASRTKGLFISHKPIIAGVK